MVMPQASPDRDTRPYALLLTTEHRVDRRILQAACSLREVGWRVDILAAYPSREDDDRLGVIRTRPSQGRTKDRSILALYRRLQRFSVAAGLTRLLQRVAWCFFADPDTFYVDLYRLAARDLRPDVVMANDLPMLPVAVRIAEEACARLVYDSHELYCEQDFWRLEKRRWRAVETRYIGRADAVITVNVSIADELRDRYGLKQVHVVLNAVSKAEEDRGRYFHQKFGLDQNSKVLLFQGGMSRDRNLQTLVGAMSLVQRPDVILVLMGEGSYQVHLERLVRRRRLSDRVRFHPMVSQDELLGVTAAADIGVIPYRANCLNNYYCTPNKLFEFIAVGLPVLSSDLPELRRFVHDTGIGLVADMRSEKKAAAAVETMVDDAQRLAAFRAASTELRDSVCWEEEEKKLVGLFETFR